MQKLFHSSLIFVKSGAPPWLAPHDKYWSKWLSATNALAYPVRSSMTTKKVLWFWPKATFVQELFPWTYFYFGCHAFWSKIIWPTQCFIDLVICSTVEWSTCFFLICLSAKCQSAKCHLAKCRLAKCRSAKCWLAKCHSVKCQLVKCRLSKCQSAKCRSAKWFSIKRCGASPHTWPWG